VPEGDGVVVEADATPTAMIPAATAAIEMITTNLRVPESLTVVTST
jgi:hypothetical protein